MVKALGNAAAINSDPSATNYVDLRVRSEAYGDLLGQIIGDADARIVTNVSQTVLAEVPEDFLHTISIVAGYTGLVAGFATVVAVIAYLF